MEQLFSKYIQSIKDTETIHYTGSVVSVKGNLVESVGPRSVIGEICTIKIENHDVASEFDEEEEKTFRSIMAEVVGLHDNIVQLSCYGDTNGIEVGCEVIGSGSILKVPVGSGLLGRVVDALGNPYDGLPPIIPESWYSSVADAPDPVKRKPIDTRILTGIRAIDSVLAVGKGQRL